MKKIGLVFIAAWAMILAAGCASGDVAKNPLAVQKIIEVPNAKSADLFVRANSACVELFRKANSVIEYSDKDAGIIKGKFNIPNVISGMYQHRVSAIITIETKDGRARLTCSDVTATITGDVLSGAYRQEGKSIGVESDSGLGQTTKKELDSFLSEFEGKIKATGSNW